MKQKPKQVVIKIDPRLYRRLKEMGIVLGGIGVPGVIKRAIKAQLKIDKEVISVEEITN